MTEQEKWEWIKSRTEGNIITTPRKTYLGRMLVIAVFICAVHAIVWGM